MQNYFKEFVTTLKYFLADVSSRNTYITAPKNNLKVIRLLGSLIFLMALIICLGGLAGGHIGELSKSRYEKSTGAFIRSISSTDSKNYEDTKTLILVSDLIQSISYLIMFLGSIIILKPELLYYELKRWGYLKEPLE